MKLKKNKKKNSKLLLELHLIKSKTYEQFVKKKYITNLDLTHIMLNFKKSLNIIFKFNKNNKRILFIGAPKTIENKINSITIHSAIPNYINLNNLIINNSITNSVKLNKYLFKNKRLFLSKIKKKPELIVIFNHIKKQSIIKESHIAKIPVIEFNSDFFSKKNKNYSYNVPGNINITQNKIIDNIFMLILNSLLNQLVKTKLKKNK